MQFRVAWEVLRRCYCWRSVSFLPMIKLFHIAANSVLLCRAKGAMMSHRARAKLMQLSLFTYDHFLLSSHIGQLNEAASIRIAAQRKTMKKTMNWVSKICNFNEGGVP